MANSLLNELGFLLNEILKNNMPYMSGNTSQNSPKIVDITSDSITIVIDAPSFDLKYWRKTKQIRHDGRYNYAKSVNDFGGFHSFNESQYWVNRSCKTACDTIASRINAEVKCYVKL